MNATTTTLDHFHDRLDSTPLPEPLPPPPMAGEPRRAATKRKRRAPLVLGALVGVAALGGLGAWARGFGREATDDAQVEGRIINVAPRVAGQVERVLVQDNQMVEAGQLLVELDHRDFDARVQAARADLAAARAAQGSAEAQLALTERTVQANVRQARGGLTQASAGVTVSDATIKQAEADVAAARARFELASLELHRVEQLRASGAVAQAALDSQKTGYEQAEAAVQQSEARLASARANTTNASGALAVAQGRQIQAAAGPQQIEVARAAVGASSAKVQQAESALTLAELAASYAYVRAPARGVVSRRSVELGQLASPERPLLAIVPPDDVWVVANFKEDQISRMKPGQSARVRIDALGGHELHGHVDSLAGASGARFALLPPDNASGNFTKVVQRVPVLVRLDDARGVPLRPGLSALVTIETR